mgnify:CR=1 FL=1
MDINIKVIGEGCEKCDKLYENTIKAVEELSGELSAENLGKCLAAAKVEKVEDLIEIVKLGVMSTPSLMINGEIRLLGQTASTQKIKELIKEYA